MLPDSKQRDLVKLAVERQTASYDWMTDNFYEQFVEVFKSYKCERDPQMKPDLPEEEDPDQTSIGMPDTWATVRRLVARGTAQIPNLRFLAKEREIAEMISRTLMYQWDRGGAQRVQKKHFTQAALFGWSVRPWHWDVADYVRTRRVNPFDPDLDPVSRAQIIQTYGLPDQVVQDPNLWRMSASELMQQYSRGGMLPVKYTYRAYEGPKTDFLLIADCFPEPNFQSLHSSRWFIVERRRDREWFKRFVKLYPEAGPGVEELFRRSPKGTPWHQHGSGRDRQTLRSRLMSAIDRVDNTNTASESETNQWTVIEMWCPGPRPSVTYVAEQDIFIHHLGDEGGDEFPYMLDGKIPFTELVLIDDLLCGIGDSSARVMRGLQQLHDRQVNVRMDLVYALLRPLIGTTDQELYDNPNLIKRLKGLRLVLMRQGMNSLWTQPEQAALAAVATGMNDESSIERQLQKLTGESNMSMAANVDPQQARTATGARLMAYQQDVLTKDVIDMFTTTGLSADAEMMFLLNRSELSDQIYFDPSLYNRAYSEGDIFAGQWLTVEPALFQIDGQIIAEAGSTLADDDEAKVQKATMLYHAALQDPMHINVEAARDEFLIAMGKGRELKRWIPPQPEPPPQEVRASLTMKMELLPPPVQQTILEKAGLLPPNQPSSPPPGGPPPPMGIPGGTPASPESMLPPPETPVATSALDAARAGSPIPGGVEQ